MYTQVSLGESKRRREREGERRAVKEEEEREREREREKGKEKRGGQRKVPCMRTAEKLSEPSSLALEFAVGRRDLRLVW